MADRIFNAGDNVPADDYSSYDSVIFQNTTGVNGTITFLAGSSTFPKWVIRTTGAGTLVVSGVANNPSVTFLADIEGISFTSACGAVMGGGTFRFGGDIDVTGMSSFNFTATAPLIFDKVGDQNIDTGSKSFNGVVSVENVPKNLNFLSGCNFGSANWDNVNLVFSAGIASHLYNANVAARRTYFNAASSLLLVVIGTRDFVNCKFRNCNATAGPFTAYNSVDAGGNTSITFALTMPRGQINMLGVGL